MPQQYVPLTEAAERLKLPRITLLHLLDRTIMRFAPRPGGGRQIEVEWTALGARLAARPAALRPPASHGAA